MQLAAPLKDLPEETPFLRATEGTESSPQHLLNLTRSLMLSYLELLHIMAINPAPPPYGIKWEDLRDLFKNAHHGLNTYRPWQARDALIKLLEQTKANAEAEIEGVQVLKVKVDRVLRDVARNCEQIAGESEDRPEQDADAMTGIEYGKQVGMADNSPTNGVVNATGEDLQERRLWTMMAEESDE